MALRRDIDWCLGPPVPAEFLQRHLHGLDPSTDQPGSASSSCGTLAPPFLELPQRSSCRRLHLSYLSRQRPGHSRHSKVSGGRSSTDELLYLRFFGVFVESMDWPNRDQCRHPWLTLGAMGNAPYEGAVAHRTSNPLGPDVPYPRGL